MQSSLEIYLALKKAKPDEQRHLLQDIPQDSVFWQEAHYALRVDLTYAYKLRFIDPPVYKREPVAQHVFIKIMDALINGTLGEANIILACEKFSQSCTRREWTLWYRPILDRTLKLPISIGLYSEYAPAQYKLAKQTMPPMVSSDRYEGPLTENFLIEPYLGTVERVLWTVSRASIDCSDHAEVQRHPRITEIFGNATDQDFYPLLIEGYASGDLLILRDWYKPKRPALTLDTRRSDMELYHSILLNESDIMIVEAYLGSAERAQNAQYLKLFLEQGYTSVVLRPLDQTYYDSTNIVLNQSKPSKWLDLFRP